MKRAPFKAYVSKGDKGIRYCHVLTHHGALVRQVPVPFPTHAEALTYALAEVGLTEKKEDRSA